MKKDELKLMMDNILEQAKSLLLRDGYLIPVAFICAGNDLGIFGLKFKTQEEKDQQIMLVRHLARTKKADAVIMVVESWYVTSDKKDLSIVPAKHPLRKECVFLIGECEEGNITIMQKFEKKIKKEKIKEEKIKEEKTKKEKTKEEKIKKEKTKEEKEEIIFGEKDSIDTNIGFSKFSFGIKDREKEKDFRGYA